jgi:hypothetical protein
MFPTLSNFVAVSLWFVHDLISTGVDAGVGFIEAARSAKVFWARIQALEYELALVKTGKELFEDDLNKAKTENELIQAELDKARAILDRARTELMDAPNSIAERFAELGNTEEEEAIYMRQVIGILRITSGEEGEIPEIITGNPLSCRNLLRDIFEKKQNPQEILGGYFSEFLQAAIRERGE